MIRVIIVLFIFFLSLLASLATITKPLFSIYEEYILKGNYTGETYSAFYFDFILYLISPLCFIFSVLIVNYIFKRKKP